MAGRLGDCSRTRRVYGRRMKEIRLNAFEMKLRRAPSPGCGRIRAIARRITPISITGPASPALWNAAGSTGSSWPMCSASTTCMAARPTRHSATPCRCRQRPCTADPGDGRGHRAFGLRRHLDPVLRATLSVCPPHVDARPSDQRGGSAGNIVTATSTAPPPAWGLPSSRATKSAMRSPDEIHAGGLSAVGGQLGRRRGVARPRAPALRRSRPDPSHPSRRAVLPGDAIHPVRAVAAAHPGPVPGRRVAERPWLCRGGMPNACSLTVRARRSWRRRSADIRRRAAGFGRDPSDILIFTLITVITGRSEADARAKHQEYRRFADTRRHWRCFPAGPASISRNTSRGTSCATSRPRRCARPSKAFTSADPNRVWTVRRTGRTCRDRRPRPAPGRRAGADRRRDDRLGRGDRHRRLQPRLCRDPRKLRGFRRAGRAGIAAPRRLPARLPRRHLAREIVRRRRAARTAASRGEIRVG